MPISDYEIIEKIAEAPQAVIYKAFHKKNPDRLLVLKILKSNNLSESQKAQFRQKIEQLKVLRDTEVITPISFESKEDICFLTREYFAGETLDKLMEARAPFPVKDFLTIACGMAQALQRVHEAGIIHGRVKSRNILVDPDTFDIRLTDFISAIDVQNVSHFIYEPSFIRGTLAYTSPEQTGRINHVVGFASDLYSIGIVFYEMLTGRVPFLSNDPLEVIHAHLAGEAPEVCEVNPNVPVVLSKIINKLMLKEPEKRYQTSRGLLADLIRCRDEYGAVGTVREFPLGISVPLQRVAFISKMIGRDQEARLVLDEYEQVVGGEFRALFISGLPGIGKTRLIQELQKPMVKHRGYFTSGKFDIYQKNIPYSSLARALRNLIRTFLTESNERVALWKERILRAVEQNGKVLTDVIPELETLIGPPPDVQPLPPVESLHRFHDVCGRFLACLATKENPLILFIDDLQWCDAASFDFLSEIFNNYQDHPYFFLLGAYRYNEVDPGHPLSRLIRDTREAGRPLKEIRLAALKPEHCHEMVSYILDSIPEQTRALAEYIGTLTEGNPLFVSESLAYLYNEGLLHPGEKQWHWDIYRIRESCMPTTVVALFGSKIQKLHPELTTLLEYCACMGNTFSPDELSLVREISLQEIFEVLKPALEQGLIIENRNRLQFVHDRVQESVLCAIPGERRRRIHWEIGTRLRDAIPESVTEYEKLDNLFDIVAHLNLGLGEDPDTETVYLISELNYYAGNKALDALAVEAANKYFNVSRELLPADCWGEGRYKRTFEILRKAAKTELMCGNYEQSERLLNELLGHTTTDLDRAECLAEQTVSLSSIGDFTRAIETANRGLAYFGKAVPVSLDEVDRRREELMAEIASKNIDIRETLLNMPFTADRKKKVESAFYSELLADLYFSGRVAELYFVAAQATLHALDGGMDEAIIYGFTAMGVYHAEREEFERSFVYEDLTHDLAAKYPNTFAATKCMNGATWTLMHTRSHPREIVEYSLNAFQCGKSCGDINNAAIAYGPVMWNLQVQGVDLPAIESYAAECLQYAGRYHVTHAMRLAEATQAGWIAPMKKDYSPLLLEKKLSEWEQEKHFSALGSYRLHRALAHYYFGEYEEAEQELAKAEDYVTANSVLKREWHVFRVLNAIRLYENKAGFKTKDTLMAEIKPIMTKIEIWAGFGPLLRPYLAFIYAELERVTGDFREARSLYLDALSAAHEQEYMFLAGHLNECLGELLRQPGGHAEGMYFAEAARLYRKCGAELKESRIAEKYPHTPAAATANDNKSLPGLDTEYLMKSSLAISAEIEQDALLNKIMKVVIECSGAQHGYMLIQDRGNLFVRAESHIAEKETPRILNQNLDDVENICKAIVCYVHRTGERILFGDAAKECMLKGSSGCKDNNLHSLLCLPVIKQSRQIGILYLENRLAESVFTPEKIRMIELLTSQAAISLENARLLEDMRTVEEELRDREKELQLISDAGPTLISYVDAKCLYRRTNKVHEQWFGLSAAQIRGRHVRDVLGETNWQAIQPNIERALAGEQVTFEREFSLPGNGKRWVNTNYTPDRDKSGRITGLVVHAMDITERKRAEDALRKSNTRLRAEMKERRKAEDQVRKSLEEKEVLLKEIHHRVKNNLQIIYSMLNLQLPYLKDKQSIEMFKESQNRIFTMALIHERLYRSESLANIDLADYVRSLVGNLLSSYGLSEPLVQSQISIDNIALNIDTVIPCALIINELVSNSLKHAFPEVSRRADGTGRIRVDMRRSESNKIVLTVSDNGIGLPEGFEVQKCQSLGLNLVSVLVKQLRGTIRHGAGSGAEFTVEF